MSILDIFEPAMCCSTGVCGPDVPQELVTFSADVDWLRSLGGEVARHNLASEPEAFANQASVLDVVQRSGSAGLPVTLVAGVVVASGRYPTRDELARWAGVTAIPAGRVPLALAQDEPGGCCGGSGCC